MRHRDDLGDQAAADPLAPPVGPHRYQRELGLVTGRAVQARVPGDRAGRAGHQVAQPGRPAQRDQHGEPEQAGRLVDLAEPQQPGQRDGVAGPPVPGEPS
ncbi:MAG TPA: hypothetical protein VGM53_27765 [Streptosporangiaceae bacterium]